MITDEEVERVPGATVYGADGEKIGKAGAVYRDDQSGRPDWMTVQTGMFGSSESFVPLADATFDGSDLRVPFDKARVKDAPRVDAEGHLDISEEDRLFEYYGMGSGESAATGTAPTGERDTRDSTEGRDTSDTRDARAETRETGDGRYEGRDTRDTGDARAQTRDTRDTRDGFAEDRDTRDVGEQAPDTGMRDDRTPDSGTRDDRFRDADDRGLRGSGHRDHDTSRAARDDDGPRHAAGTAAAAAGGVGSLGLVAAAAAERSGRSDTTDTRTPEARDGTRDRDDVGDGGADWRDQRREQPVAASAPAQEPARTGLTRDPGGSSGAERRPRLSQWVLVERSSIIELSEEDAARLTGRGADDTGPSTR